MTRERCSSTIIAMTEYLLGLDQGSSYSKAVLVDRKGKTVSQAAMGLDAFRPRPGWVEQDPRAILKSQLGAVGKMLRSVNNKKIEISGLGIANQRSTLIFWDKKSGLPLTPALSWQDLRTAETIHKWKEHRSFIHSRTGLMLTPYYSASKLKWILDHIKGLRAKIKKGDCLCGTVNTYLIWHLTKGEVYATDPTNAARMLLMNLKSLTWDDELLNLFDIPLNCLPPICPTVADFGRAKLFGMDIPIRASIGDQQGGLAGVGALSKGKALINYGTGGFFLVNAGSRPIFMPGLLTSLAWTTSTDKAYVIEGTVNSVGTLFAWLMKIGLLDSAKVIDRLVKSSFRSSNEALNLIPALSGLGAPHWVSEAKGAIFGISATTEKGDLVRAALEGVSFRIKDIAEVIRIDGRVRIQTVTVSGGGSRISSLVQTQADLLGLSVQRCEVAESTAVGSALLAGVGCGWWKTPLKIPSYKRESVFHPKLSRMEGNKRYREWKKRLEATRLLI
ncbi:MAG: glycerol kinase [Nitrospirae bacterium]|nr:glycerol kinase [Nitrospirota bacterium]